MPTRASIIREHFHRNPDRDITLAELEAVTNSNYGQVRGTISSIRHEDDDLRARLVIVRRGEVWRLNSKSVPRDSSTGGVGSFERMGQLDSGEIILKDTVTGQLWQARKLQS